MSIYIYLYEVYSYVFELATSSIYIYLLFQNVTNIYIYIVFLDKGAWLRNAENKVFILKLYLMFLNFEVGRFLDQIIFIYILSYAATLFIDE